MDSCILHLRVHPGARHNEVVGFVDGVLDIKVAAPPVEGKANRELIEFLSGLLRISKSSLKITKGQTGRHKTVAVTGLTLEQTLSRLT